MVQMAVYISNFERRNEPKYIEPKVINAYLFKYFEYTVLKDN